MAEDSLIATDDNPYELFGKWFEDAKASEPNDPDAVALASATPDGRPSVRMVLLKNWSEKGFVFYTNYDSRKGKELEANSFAAMLFHWKSLRRQIRIEGTVEKVSEEEADAYFATRPLSSQIGAWASLQSQPMEGRYDFEKRIAQFTAKYALSDVPRPPRWSGFRLIADRIEFWQDRKFRLHDRVAFMLEDRKWKGQRLYP